MNMYTAIVLRWFVLFEYPYFLSHNSNYGAGLQQHITLSWEEMDETRFLSIILVSSNVVSWESKVVDMIGY